MNTPIELDATIEGVMLLLRLVSIGVDAGPLLKGLGKSIVKTGIFEGLLLRVEEALTKDFGSVQIWVRNFIHETRAHLVLEGRHLVRLSIQTVAL
mmetsp:Transcript_39571/g.60474  ORF Transcript_39571/g.60474 Transcript_39571/m.60474 type:complete len:95 (-) Transcript_39571:351-635(-)